MNEPPRASRPGTAPPPPLLSPAECAALESRNGLRQFDRLVELINEAVVPGASFRLRPSVLFELNRYAVDGLVPAPGFLRQVPIRISGTTHQPPPAEDLAALVEGMCDYVASEWARSPVHLSAYVMWRLNWIHPFVDGNGRTSRAASYLILCARLGYRLPGTSTIPERIAADKTPYYRALDAADEAWRRREVDVSEMETLLAAHLAAQLVEIHQQATAEE